MPQPRNEERRRALADAAIAILAGQGSHHLTHRTVDRRAGVPVGTTANYFPQRDDLLDAAARRIVELSVTDMTTATAPTQTAPPPPPDLASLLGESLFAAATVLRERYLAIYELLLEATRRPRLAQTLGALSESTVESTLALHRLLDLGTTRAQVETMVTLYGGALYALVTSPDPAEVTRDQTRALADAIVTGVLGAGR
ncbi:MAG: TetR/AcrR family transcriptional regulator [Streptosporangiaceae bacterium]